MIFSLGNDTIVDRSVNGRLPAALCVQSFFAMKTDFIHDAGDEENPKHQL